MKRHLIFVAGALCVLASVASAQAVNPNASNPVGIAPTGNLILITRGLRDYRNQSASRPVIKDIRRYLPLASSDFESHFVGPYSESVKSPVLPRVMYFDGEFSNGKATRILAVLENGVYVCKFDSSTPSQLKSQASSMIRKPDARYEYMSASK